MTTMRKKRYARLRGAIAEAGYTLQDIADEWNIERGETSGWKYANWLSPFLNGKRPWRSDVMYWLMDLLELPHEQLGLYFPANGEDEKNNVSGGNTDDSN